MSNLKELPKPNNDITDYEWEITPLAVKKIIDRLQHLTEQKQENLISLQRENKWLREQLEIRLDKSNRSYKHPLPEVLLWAAVGVILTTICTFLPAYTIAAPWSWLGNGLGVNTLGVSYQIGAVLLIACVGGKNSAFISQISYVSLGLAGLPVFDQGGGFNYLLQPNFGYLIGFAFGGWLCGWLAFQTLVRFSSLVASCLVGLLAIHIVGISYLTMIYFISGLGEGIDSFFQAISIYSLNPLPGHLAVLCATSLVAFSMRKLMFS